MNQQLIFKQIKQISFQLREQKDIQSKLETQVNQFINFISQNQKLKTKVDENGRIIQQQRGNINVIERKVQKQKLLLYALISCLVIFVLKSFFQPKSLPNNKRIKQFSNGNYEGQLNYGEKNGKGIMSYKDGSKYDGEWQNDKRSGFGIFYQANGQKYEGEWKQDKKNGQGIFYSNEGQRYFGGFLNDVPHGKGVLHQKDYYGNQIQKQYNFYKGKNID